MVISPDTLSDHMLTLKKFKLADQREKIFRQKPGATC